MTQRKPHPDNALIDQLEEDGPAPGQGSSSGGNVARTVGTRSEMRNTAGATGTERDRSQDNPVDAEMKGVKTIERLDPARKGPSSE
jgi:hypothetical protein